jgi:hypothetical protein
MAYDAVEGLNNGAGLLQKELGLSPRSAAAPSQSMSWQAQKMAMEQTMAIQKAEQERKERRAAKLRKLSPPATG